MLPPVPPDLTNQVLFLAGIVGHNPIGQDGITLVHITLVNGHKDRLFLTNQDHFYLGSGNRGIQQISAQHDVVLLQYRDDDYREFSALAFMDADTI